MADYIRVSTAELWQAARELDALQDIIEGVAEIIAGVDTSKSSGGELRVQASGSLVSGSTAAEVTRSLCKALRNSARNAGMIAAGARKSAEIFEETENGLCNKLSGNSTGTQNNVYDGDGHSGSNGGSSGTGGGSEEKKDGNWFTDWFDKWFDYEPYDHGIGGTAWAGKYSAEAEGKWGSHAGVNAYFGKFKGGIDYDFTTPEGNRSNKYGKDKDKKGYEWTESDSATLFGASVTAGVSGSVFAVDMDAGIGDENLGVQMSAEGGLGNVALEGKSEFSVDENGDMTALVEGKAMVSAAEGKAHVDFDILGFEITGTIGGYAGAFGWEGKAGVEDGKLVLEGGAAAFLGASAGLSIGVNEEWWEEKIDNIKEGWSDFVDFAKFWD